MRLGCTVILLLLLAVPTSASAAVVTVRFAGVIDTVLDPTGLLSLSLDGHGLEGTFTYDSTTPGRLAIGTLALDPYWFDDAQTELSFTLGGFGGTMGSASRMFTTPQALGGGAGLRAHFTPVDPYGLYGQVWTTLSLVVREIDDPVGPPFIDAGSLPETIPSFESFQDARWSSSIVFGTRPVLDRDAHVVSGRLTRFEVVPEPSTALLIATGLLLVARHRRRRTIV